MKSRFRSATWSFRRGSRPQERFATRFRPLANVSLVRLALTAFAILAFASLTQPAFAAATGIANVTGGVDPSVGLVNLLPWVQLIAAGAIVTFCAFKGAHAVADGRSLMPAIGYAFGGTMMTYGGGYLLTHWGV